MKNKFSFINYPIFTYIKNHVIFFSFLEGSQESLTRDKTCGFYETVTFSVLGTFSPFQSFIFPLKVVVFY